MFTQTAANSLFFMHHALALHLIQASMHSDVYHNTHQSMIAFAQKINMLICGVDLCQPS